jgi:hypothetical protein
MATKTESILALLNQIRNDQQLVLPDIQRDFVWRRDQIRLLLDSVMRGYPFGSLLLWQTRFLEVPYREFVIDYVPAMIFVPKTKSKGTPLRMVLDGQQRLQSLYIALYGTHDKHRLYFNVTSGPGTDPEADDPDDGLTLSYRFEFWRDDDTNRPRRLLPVGEMIGWPARHEDQMIEKAIESIGLQGDEASRARRNMRLIRSVMSQSDLVPVETIDESAPDEASARMIDEILEIFVRVNTGGTRLNRSDLMFSLLKSKWKGARLAFDEVVQTVEARTPLGIDKDFVIRGLLAVADAPVRYAVETVQNYWPKMEAAYETFSRALRNAVDFCRSPDVGILSSSLLRPVATLFPVVYYLYQQPNCSLPDADRQALRSFLYFALFSGYVKSEARIRYLRDELRKNKGKPFPLDALLKIIAKTQRHYHVSTTAEMLKENPRLALNVAQPAVAKETLSWQEEPQIDHIFPQSVFRPRYGDIVDDIANLAYLGRLRNIRKNDEMPADYFSKISDDELRDNFLIPDRALLQEARFEEFLQVRSDRLLERVKTFLGR